MLFEFPNDLVVNGDARIVLDNLIPIALFFIDVRDPDPSLEWFLDILNLVTSIYSISYHQVSIRNIENGPRPRHRSR